jgi:hypothetical protein
VEELYCRAVRNQRGRSLPLPEPEAVEAAELYLIEQAQKLVDINQIKALLPKIVVMTDKLGHERKIILVGGRVKGRFWIGYNKDGMPVLPSKCHLSDLYLFQAHEVDHGGINNMIMRSRIIWKPLQQQKMPPSLSSGWNRSRCSAPRLWIFLALLNTRTW